MATKKRTTRKAAKKTTKRTTKKTPAKRAAKKTATPARKRKIETGLVSHTELASADPPATKKWTQKVLGWKFGEPFPTPNGPYHMWTFGKDMGGGIRANAPQENPGSIPYCEVPVIKTAFAKAIKNGANEMMPPTLIGPGMGWIAVVIAPGGVPIGFWAPK